MAKYSEILQELRKNKKKWLITGVGGFIGSNLLETLLINNQDVVGLDNFSTGSFENLEQVQASVSREQWKNFSLIEGSVRDSILCENACETVDYVLHQAALGSVPRSLADPIKSNESNITGHLNMLWASKNLKVSSFTYAASSSTYGDHPALPKIEERIGKSLSPYAVTKLVNELYAEVFSRCYDFNSIGLRYFNVFGKRQDPNGAYAAVIPRWTRAMIKGDDIQIFGDGETSRDFCYIENVVQANILAAVAPMDARGQIYNVALGERTTLNELFGHITHELRKHNILYDKKPHFKSFRNGDVRHSQADISKAKIN